MDGAAKKDDSLENGDEKVTLLGGKQRRDFIARFAADFASACLR